MSNGIPATRPMISADDMIAIKGCTLQYSKSQKRTCNQPFWRSNKVTHYKFLLMNMCCNYFYISGALLDHGYTITIGFSAFNTYDVCIFFSAKRQKQAVIFPCSPPVFCIFLLSFIKKRFYNIQYVWCIYIIILVWLINSRCTYISSGSWFFLTFFFFSRNSMITCRL